MGIFHENVEIINRTSKPLHLRYDGQDMELPPNYDKDGALLKDVHTLIPKVTVDYAKSQNVQMGSEDPMDPSSFEVLVGVKAAKGQKQTDAISFLEQSKELTRVQLDEYLLDPTLKIMVGGRQVRMSDAKAGIRTAPFDVVPRS